MLKILIMKLNNKMFYVQRSLQGYQINSAYKISENFSYINEMYTWSNLKGLKQDYPFSLFLNRTNMEGSNISVGIVITNNESLNHLADYRFKCFSMCTFYANQNIFQTHNS